MPTDSTTCDRAREALWPDPTSGPPEALAHLDACRDCQGFFQRDRRLSARFAAVTRQAAPAGLQARVAAVLDRAGSRPRVGWRVAVGTLALAAAVVLAVLSRRDPMDAMVRPFATEAHSSDLALLALASSDVDSVTAWLTNALGSRIAIPVITDATLMGGRIVRIGGHRAAALVYHMHGDPLTYFALAEMEVAGRPVATEDIMMGAAEDVEVAVWRQPDGVRAVAAAMPRSVVAAVASECRQKAMMAVVATATGPIAP